MVKYEYAATGNLEGKLCNGPLGMICSLRHQERNRPFGFVTVCLTVPLLIHTSMCAENHMQFLRVRTFDCMVTLQVCSGQEVSVSRLSSMPIQPCSGGYQLKVVHGKDITPITLLKYKL